MTRCSLFVMFIAMLILLNTSSSICMSRRLYYEQAPRFPRFVYVRTVYIRSDGSVDPPDAPILRVNDTYYVLSSDIRVSGDLGIVIERDNVILDGRGFWMEYLDVYRSTGILVKDRSNVTIKNIVFSIFSRAIVLNNTRNSVVENNTFRLCDICIYVENSNDNILLNNNVNIRVYRDYTYPPYRNGIFLINSHNNEIIENNVECSAGPFPEECSYLVAGMKLVDSGNNYVSINKFYNTGVFILSNGGVSNFFSNNTVNNKPLLYLENVSDLEITGDYGQVIVFNGRGLRIHGLVIQRTSVAIHLYNVTNSLIFNNVLIYNYIGLVLSYVRDSTIFNNTFSYNVKNMFLEEVYRNTFYLNTICFGGMLGDKYIGTNFWDNGEVGNYWCFYSGDCPDRDRDNICDTPYEEELFKILDRRPLKRPPQHAVQYIKELLDELATALYSDLARGCEERTIAYVLASILTTLGVSLIVFLYIMRKHIYRRQAS